MAISLRGICSSCKEDKSVYFGQVLNSKLIHFSPVSHFYISIPSENFRKPMVFSCFQGVQKCEIGLVSPRAEVKTMDARKRAVFCFRPFGANLVQ